MDNDKKVLGLNENIVGALCYFLFWLTGIAFLIAERENKFVRFHALQSLVTFLGLHVILFVIGILTPLLSMILLLIPGIGPIIALILLPIIYILLMLMLLSSGILWIVMMYKAYSGERFKLPVVGDFVEKRINK